MQKLSFSSFFGQGSEKFGGKLVLVIFLGESLAGSTERVIYLEQCIAHK